MYKLIGLIFTLFLLSCSSDKTGVSGQEVQGTDVVTQTSQTGDQASSGDYSLEIVPVNATKTTRLYAVPHGFSLNDAKIEWLVNGERMPSSKAAELDSSVIKKHDKIQAKVTIQGQEIVSNIVHIGNSPPEISSVKIMPEVFRQGDTLRVDASGTDIDGDEVMLSYEWTRNGESAGSSRQLETSLKRGDKISVTITPFDGTDYGRPGTLHRGIVNLPPMIKDSRKYLFDGKRYSHQVSATDPDGDGLTYSLKNAPSGMLIDASSGLITWDVPPDFTGRGSFTVAVTDGHGGESTQELTLEIRPEQKK